MTEALNPILFSSWCRISKMAIVFVPDHSRPQRSHFTYHLPKAMSVSGVRREKAALSSGCKSHPATAPAGSNRSSYGGNEVAEAFGKRVTKYGDSASV